MKPEYYIPENVLDLRRIKAAYELMTIGERRDVIKRHWDLIPSPEYGGELTDEQKIAYIVAAQPDPGAYPPEYLAWRLVHDGRPEPCHADDYSGPMLRFRLQANCPDLYRDLLDRMRPERPVPAYIVTNQEWLGLTAVHALIRAMTDDGLKPGKTKFPDAAQGLDGKTDTESRVRDVLVNWTRFKHAVSAFADQETDD